MTQETPCIYTGTVVHKRLVPVRHAFSYRVFSLCLDVDAIDDLSSSLRLFSRNRWNVFSFHDRDHGSRSGETVAAHVRSLLLEGGLEAFGCRIELLCYPRLLGFVFNPLSVYFCRNDAGHLGVIIYEVSNTFGERRSYVIAVADHGGGTIFQACAKEMYVSPFTVADGHYAFRVRPPGDYVLVGVDFRAAPGPVLKTHFRGTREALTDSAILGLLLRYPLMTLRVLAGIHSQAARLWLKGVPVAKRHVSPSYAFTIVTPTQSAAGSVTTGEA